MINRRSGRRNQFHSEKNINNMTVVICIIITIISVMTTVIVLISNKSHNSSNMSGNVKSEIEISKENIVKINTLISFLNSNINYGDSIDDENTKYYLACKQYSIDNKFNKIPESDITKLAPDVYRELGYIYFDDLKDEYMYINKQDFIKTYNNMFAEEENIEKIFSKYFISSIDGIVVPKNITINDSKQYKVQEYLLEDNKLIVTMQEVDLYKLYKDKSYEEILEYLKDSNIDNEYAGTTKIKVILNVKEDNYVFEKYSN